MQSEVGHTYFSITLWPLLGRLFQAERLAKHVYSVLLSLGQHLSQRPSFFALRISLGLISSLCEAQMIQSVAKYVNARVGSYLFFMLLTSAGMWSASTGKDFRASLAKQF